MNAALILGLVLTQTTVAIPAPSILVSVTPKSGQPVVGRVQQTFELNATFGKALPDPDKIASIQFGEPMVLKTTDNTILRGTLASDAITVKLAEGEVRTFKFSELKSLQTIQRAAAVAGEISNGRSANGMTYHVRAPPEFEPGESNNQPAIIILHGSNMNSLDYVNSIATAWPDIAKEYILIGINGERTSSSSTNKTPRYNYSYVNFVGKSTYRGFPGTDRESPALVAEVVQELRDYLPIKRLFVGGHSQGGYLTYSVIMNYPDLFDGAFPVSAGQIFQTEPTAYDNAELRKLQRQKPIAIVHGETDRTVGIAGARTAYDNYMDDGFPMVRLFSHPTAGHRFMLLPVPDAIQWLEEMNGDDPARLIELAEQRLQSDHRRESIGLLDRATAADSDGKHSGAIDKLRQLMEEQAGPAANRLLKAIEANDNGDWIDDYLAFRQDYEFTQSAQPVLAAFNRIRDQHQKPANELYGAARKDLRAGKKDDAYEKYRTVVQKYYASRWYSKMKRWVQEAK